MIDLGPDTETTAALRQLADMHRRAVAAEKLVEELASQLAYAEQRYRDHAENVDALRARLYGLQSGPVPRLLNELILWRTVTRDGHPDDGRQTARDAADARWFQVQVEVADTLIATKDGSGAPIPDPPGDWVSRDDADAELAALRGRVCDMREATRADSDSYLRSKGYLILPPGDTSPLGMLVRGACHWVSNDLSQREAVRYAKDRLWNAAKMALRDPTVRAWVERGRHG